jgi:hypothetical protein
MLRKLITLLLAGTAGQALAIENHFNGKETLLCTIMTAQLCDVYGCERADREKDLGGVHHLVIDFKRNRIKAPVQENTNVSAPIGQTRLVDDRLFLHGVNERAGVDANEARSWNMLIANPTGLMTLTVAGEEVALTMFGACTPVD